MKKIIILLLFVLNIFCLAQSSFAENFYIKNYDVVMNVDKYKRVQIEETIDAFFTNSSHGIFRIIPTKNGDYIDNISVNKQNSISKNYNSTTIKIGNPDVLVNGDQHYTIDYTYHINDEKNEFYFNIIGTKWNTDINKVNFKITMPDNIDADKVGLSIGSYGTKGFKDIAKYNVNSNMISGTTLTKLSPNDGITIRVEVPKGYFIQSPFEKIKPLITILIILILTYISFCIWAVYGKDEHVTPVVSFYPPEGLNSAQVGVLYNENADVKDVVSLIFYLAGKGYIKIINNGANDFSIEKLKDYNGNIQEEKKLMNALFHSDSLNGGSSPIFAGNIVLDAFFNPNKKSDNAKDTLTKAFSLASQGYINITHQHNGDLHIKKLRDYDGDIPKEKELMDYLFPDDKDKKIESKKIVTKNDLMYSETFYRTVQHIVYILEKHKTSMITKNSQSVKHSIPAWLCTEGIAFSIFYTFSNYSFDFLSSQALMVLWALFCSGILFIICSKIPGKIFKTIVSAWVILSPCLVIPMCVQFVVPPIWVLAIHIACLIVSIVCLQNLSKWSEQAVKLKGQILGFKHFLDVAEKHKIEELSKENPDYASDMIAFAYVLGISTKWIKMLETMMITPPSWYQGDFSYHSFHSFSDSFYSVSIPSTSNGGISSTSSGGGGGFSGGGCGGGGGGSW